MILKTNVDAWWNIAWPRDNKEYGYGGNWQRDNVWATTDCSGIVSYVLAMLTGGPANFKWPRYPVSTESYRVIEVGQRGPFGTICVASPQDIPADAAVKIGCMHGGGGENSHMACTLMDRPGGINIESSGSYGQRMGGPARGYNNPIFHDWHYLPGPIQSEDWAPVLNELMGIS